MYQYKISKFYTMKQFTIVVFLSILTASSFAQSKKEVKKNKIKTVTELITDYVGGKRDISPEIADKAIEMLAARKDPTSPDIIAKRDTKKQMIQQEKEQKMEREKRENDYAKSARGIEDRKASQERQDKEYLDYLKNHGTKEDIKEYLKQMRDRNK